MQKMFQKNVTTFQKVANKFDPDSILQKRTLLNYLSGLDLPAGKYITPYHDLLMFLIAYPTDHITYKLAERELKRISTFGIRHRYSTKALPENEGLPYSAIVTQFSPDFLRWLIQHEDLRVSFDSFNDPTLTLNDVLNITLPAVLKAETTAGVNNTELLEVLHINPSNYVPFLLGQIDALNDHPLLQELFIDRLSLYVKLTPKNAKFSRIQNRIQIKDIFYHTDLLKNFDVVQQINEPVPGARIPHQTERKQLLKIIKNAMALTVREIDPATFLQEESIRSFDLGRGITLVVYSMISKRQLPLETYFGFTLFKNGIPVSYGGVWPFGPMAKIGLNIFEPFRGGESGYLVCQLMRVLKNAFGVTYFEIEPTQFGLDNPDGITSGAFWFYHKLGFRPVDPELKKLARLEFQKIKFRNNYRSSAKTLLRFTEGNLGFNLGKKLPLNVLDVMGSILSKIKTAWPDNYLVIKKQASQNFCAKVRLNEAKLNAMEKNVLEEISLWAMAMNIQNARQLSLMKQMVLIKTKDDYKYQQLLLDFFKH